MSLPQYSRLALLFAALALVVSPLAAEDPPALRLDDRAEPLRYTVGLTIDPRLDTFEGHISIDLRIHRATNLLWLNATNLVIERARLLREGRGVNLEVRKGGEHHVGLALPSLTQPGEARLEITYRGQIQAKTTAGIFKAKDGDDWYVLTQFEAFEARRAFPCFDEPIYKTPWQLSLSVPKDMSAFANTPVLAAGEDDNGNQTFQFAASKPLPSYLVAFAVGPFETVEARDAGRNATPVRIITPRGKASQAKYAAEVTPEILEWLEEYFDLPYPYEKLDSIAIPVAFGFGAMENAGLVTYIQPLLLADPAKDSIQRQRSYYSTAAHELAHQWFGDLVTPEWWDDIWLNEAFATWMAGKLVEKKKPEWAADLSAVSSRLAVMRQDSLISARRIRNPINSHSDITAAFDRITYTKGQAVVRMFEAWLGEEGFRAGVRRYLKQYAWGNASAGDFMDTLASPEHPNVGTAFATFLNQGGVPLISVALDCSAEGTPVLALAQKRALPVGSQGSDDQLWRTPFCVRYEVEGKTRRECFLLAEPSARWTLPNTTSCPAWLSPNAGGEGYYQVGYDDELLKPLLANGGAVLTAAERISVAGDVQAGFEMGTLEAGSALALVPEFAGDPDRNVVTATIRIAGRIWPHMVEDELQANYVRFLNAAFGEHAAKLGWTPAAGENEDTRLLRGQVVFFMATRGEQQELARQANELALRWIEDRRALPPEMVSAVISTAAYQGTRDLYDRYVAALSTTTSRQERQQLYGALGSFRDPEIVKEALALLLDEKHDIRESLGSLWTAQATPEIRRLRWEFVQHNFDALIARLPAEGGFQLGARLPDVGNVFCSEQDARDLDQFFGERVKKFNGGQQNLSETLESVRLCAALKSAQQESVSAFLQGY